MKLTLVIDQGNTAAKAAVFDGDMLLCSRRYRSLGVEEIEPLLDEYHPAGAIYGTVARTDAKFAESLRRILDRKLLILTHDTPLPIEIDYATPRSLGADRVAAAAGAARLFPGESVLIADAGSALTLDYLEEGRIFRGGNISPGMTMRFDVLHAGTGRLPLVSPDGPAPLFGRDTEQAIRSGVIRGMACEIRGTFLAAKRAGCQKIVMTGGDAPHIADCDELSDLPISLSGALVAAGLNYIYQFNENL